MKACPFCAEQIQDAAIKCRHCGSMLAAEVALPDDLAGGSSTPATKSKPSQPAGSIVSKALIFGGLWLLLMGGSEFYSASSTRNAFRGTVVEHSSDANTLIGNVESAGVWKIGLGLLLFMVGGVLSTMRPSSAPKSASPQQARGSAKSSTKRSGRAELTIAIVGLGFLIAMTQCGAFLP